MLVAEQPGPGPAATGNRIKVPTCYVPKVSANVSLQDAILNGKAIWFGVWILRTLLGKLMSSQQPMKFYRGNQLLVLLGNGITQGKKAGKRERERNWFMILRVPLPGPWWASVCSVAKSQTRLKWLSTLLIKVSLGLWGCMSELLILVQTRLFLHYLDTCKI